jgi:undecaprenyl-diphosphatase
MTLLQSIILGIVQGFTEFFPVSSSAHLRLAKWLMGVSDGEHLLRFDLVCHSGTLLALILFLRKDISLALRNSRAVALFALALCPLVPAYFLLKPLRIAASDPAYLGYFLMFTAFLLFFSSRMKSREQRGSCKTQGSSILGFLWAFFRLFEGGPYTKVDIAPLQTVEKKPTRTPKSTEPEFCNCLQIPALPKVKDVLCIGIMQAMALLPGISRSGSTIAAGRLLGWDWVAAARFSFILAIPAILGGQALETLKAMRGVAVSEVSISCYAAGFITSFMIGMIGVRFMFKIYELGIVRPFAWYCFAAGILALWAFHA